ncbi:alpha/beta hydrolase [Bacillus sp. V3-13]|uniref:alpha/beta hydrolase n=1 Tax=Bacillus sp. V3-13 TaxID=2053728 RepID=UPI000C7883A4|nr:alpha/beta hydrolase [Bacillus sp. V3-13]PLR78207.1 alpha/beta hydrolase [Bacillus sp. V3-13]
MALVKSTIDKTLLTANLFDGFWDRWIVHGVEREDIDTLRSSYLTKDRWMDGWRKRADQKFLEAEKLEQDNSFAEAEMKFRAAGLYYQLMQWLIPERKTEKIGWLNVSLSAFEKADKLSPIKAKYVQLPIGEQNCFGRVRIPSQTKGVVIIINPLDSTKEELFTYELDFISKGYIVVSFDGPGQGQTFTFEGLRGTTRRWESFIDVLIDFTSNTFPNLPINLFGTSSGAAWALYGSCNPKVNKTVAVSPAFVGGGIKLPDYFVERSRFVLEEEKSLPSYELLPFRNPVMLFHGKQDVMVSDSNIYHLYEQLPQGKCLVEYEEEGHCCNYKLAEIRQKAVEWFESDKEV